MVYPVSFVALLPKEIGFKHRHILSSVPQNGIPLPVSGKGGVRSTGQAGCDPDHSDAQAFLIIKLMSVFPRTSHTAQVR